MPRIKDTSNAQSKFLRAFHEHPAGPYQDDWPSPAVLRRWMRKPGFRRALDSVKDTLRLKADLHLATTSSLAMHHLQSDLLELDDPAKLAESKPSIDAATRLLRLSQNRIRHLPHDLTDHTHPFDVEGRDADLLEAEMSGLYRDMDQLLDSHRYIFRSLRDAPPDATAADVLRQLDLDRAFPKWVEDFERRKRRAAQQLLDITDFDALRAAQTQPPNTPGGASHVK